MEKETVQEKPIKKRKPGKLILCQDLLKEIRAGNCVYRRVRGYCKNRLCTGNHEFQVTRHYQKYKTRKLQMENYKINDDFPPMEDRTLPEETITETIVLVDFSAHLELLAKLIKIAKEDIRTAQEEIIWLVANETRE